MKSDVNSDAKEKSAGAQDAPSAHLSRLNYEAPRDRVVRDPPVNVLGVTFAFACGFGISAGVAIVVSGFLYFLAETVASEHIGLRFGALGYCIAAIFISLRIATAVTRPGFRTIERWFGLGFLMGLGVACLIEGICFAVTP